MFLVHALFTFHDKHFFFEFKISNFIYYYIYRTNKFNNCEKNYKLIIFVLFSTEPPLLSHQRQDNS